MGQPRVFIQTHIMSEAIASEVDEVDELGERTWGSFRKWFDFSSGTILLITGIAKAWSALGSSKFLTVVDLHSSDYSALKTFCPPTSAHPLSAFDTSFFF